ncbi:hypothetical protein CB0101_07675 [Synechococcus sp. CB0101]|uniref:hypothetical protein n=1 Tax=Synechococcus sp. CB0101 TaxID=232348 RepID=UPI0002001310|nr:hypothetical protein [Synechococcus sp. CB0101]QCH14821.1 hypothetical protein CB0101_07675 [Synechococcus sp. CB0101]
MKTTLNAQHLTDESALQAAVGGGLTWKDGLKYGSFGPFGLIPLMKHYEASLEASKAEHAGLSADRYQEDLQKEQSSILTREAVLKDIYAELKGASRQVV